MKIDERIADGECISPRGVEHCPNCSDRCEASHWGMEVSEAIKPKIKKQDVINWWNSLKHYEKKGYCKQVFNTEFYYDLRINQIAEIYKHCLSI
jgi:hypothetical protein